MTLAPRQTQIVEALHERGELTVEFFAQQFGVSDMTIRRDLQSLAEAGKVIRTHGGAAPAARVSFEFQFGQRSRTHDAEKRAIAAEAVRRVQDGQSIMLDSGTTTLELAKRLKSFRGLTVITTSLPIASELQFAEGVEVLLLGGLLRRDAPDLTGALTESNLENLRAEIAFVGADGIDDQGNIFNVHMPVARMLEKMTRSANEVYVVADHSKLGKTALARFGNVASWNGLITDAAADEKVIEKLSAAKVKVIRAGETA